jgi:hypothetical protein
VLPEAMGDTGESEDWEGDVSGLFLWARARVAAAMWVGCWKGMMDALVVWSSRAGWRCVPL